MQFDLAFIADYSQVLLNGLLTSLQFVSISIVLGMTLGFALSLMRTSKSLLLRWLSTIYVEVVRGTPVLVQLFWIFFCLPAFFGTELSGFSSAVITLTLYFAAITSETFRSSIKAIDGTQLDACVALGISPWTRTVFVILPQAVLRAIPNLSSNVVSLFKESALVSAVGLADLMYIGQNIANAEARPVEVLTVVAIIYFVVAFPLTRLAAFIERRLLKVITA
jgi:polar amino acid transport system permease protein